MRRITAYVRLDDRPAAVFDALDRARSGDESWREWVDDYRAGEALVVRLRVEVEFDGPCGRGIVDARNADVWVQRSLHPPEVEAQVQEIVPKDFDAFEAEFARRGIAIGAHDLDRMHVRVELGPDVLRALYDNASARVRVGSAA